MSDLYDIAYGLSEESYAELANRIANLRHPLPGHFCDDCAHLGLTEAQQNSDYAKSGKKTPHYCRAYNQVVQHKGHHPHIAPVSGCEAYEVKQ